MTFDPTIRSMTIAALGFVLLAGTAIAQTATETNEAAPAAEATTNETGTEAGTAGDEAAGPETQAPSEDFVDLTAASVLATVEGKPITLGEIISLRRDLPEQYQFLPDEILSQGLLDQLIDQTLLAEAAREAKVDERLDVALSITNQIRAVLADAWLRAEVTRRMTEARLRDAYDTRYAAAQPEDEVHAAHILVESEDLAKQLKAELDGGADFAALAAEHGTDGTASRGGDLGWFVKGDMVPEFAEAAFAIEPGQIGGPIETPFGWHLIKVEERRVKPVPAFEEVREELTAELAQTVQTEILEELRGKAEIILTEPPIPAAAIRADDLIVPVLENEAK